MKPFATTAALPLLLAFACAAHAANECKIEYGYHTGSGFTLENTKVEIDMNVGQEKTIDRTGMNYVKNLKSNKVQVTLSGAFDNNLTLDKDERNPSLTYYSTSVTLNELKCLEGTSAPSYNSPEQLISALKQTNTATSEIAKQLKSVFGKTESQVATLLKNAGYTAAQVAAALKSAFNATAAQVAGWLHSAGYTGAQVAAALKSQFNVTAEQNWQLLRSLFDATDTIFTVWLKEAAYSKEQVIESVLSQMDASFQSQMQVMQGANYTLFEVAQALRVSSTEDREKLKVLKQVYGASWTNVVKAFQTAAKALQPLNCGAAGCNQGAQLLKDADAKAEETLKALKDVYNLNAESALHIARNIYGLTEQRLNAAMVAAGYAAVTGDKGTSSLN